MAFSPEIVGKVVATSSQPSTVDAFAFWLKAGRESAIEVGNIVTALDDDSKVYGLVTRIQSYTDAESALVDYLSHEFGDPSVESPTLRQSIHVAVAEVIGASPPRIRPVSAGLVRLSTPDEVQEAYGMDQIDDPILIGVIPNGRKPELFAPAFLSERFVLGPEGAHVNFSGASGLATKTSAAVFLIRSMLSRAKRQKKKVAVVAFNVKETDLLYLERNSGDGLEELIQSEGGGSEKQIATILRQHDVSVEFDSREIQYFAPGRRFDPSVPHSLRSDGRVKSFFWSLESVKKKGAPIRLEHLFDPDDLDERSVGVISAIEEHLESDWESEEHFRSLIERLPTGKKDWEGHSGHTVSKVRRLLSINCREILRGLFTYDDAEERDIPIERIQAGQCFVVDIQSLNDKGKRIVFFNILSRLATMLEDWKNQRDQGKDVPLDAIIVFVDELNKFAPSSRSVGHGLKDRIIEIAARGRSIGLVLFGAEQFASHIETEVYGNCATHFVGRTEHVELGDRAYRWISRDLQYVASTLPKGFLLCKHALFARPLLIRFPRPLHTYSPSDIDELLNKSRQPATIAKVTIAEEHFERLRKLLKGRNHASPVVYYQGNDGIRALGVGQSKFTAWYKAWVSRQCFHSGTDKEKEAIRLLMSQLEADAGVAK